MTELGCVFCLANAIGSRAALVYSLPKPAPSDLHSIATCPMAFAIR